MFSGRSGENHTLDRWVPFGITRELCNYLIWPQIYKLGAVDFKFFPCGKHDPYYYHLWIAVVKLFFTANEGWFAPGC